MSKELSKKFLGAELWEIGIKYNKQKTGSSDSFET